MSEHFVSGVSAKIALYKYASFPFLSGAQGQNSIMGFLFPTSSHVFNAPTTILLLLFSKPLKPVVSNLLSSLFKA